MRKEYDFSRGVRGKYAKQLSGDIKVILLEADVAKIFPDSRSVNEALRVFAEAARRQSRSRGGRARTAPR